MEPKKEQITLSEEAGNARRFRAVLTGVPPRRSGTGILSTQQCFSSSYHFLKKWGKDLLTSYPLEEFPQAAVVIYESKEVMVGAIVPESSEKPKEDKETKGGTTAAIK